MMILFVNLLWPTLLLKINGSLAQRTHTDRFHSTNKTRSEQKTAKHAVYQTWCFLFNGCHKEFQFFSLTAKFNFTASTWYKTIHTNHNPKLQSIDNWFLSVWCAITICWCFWFIISVIGQLWIVCNDALYFWICYLFLAAPYATVQNSIRNKNLDASESCEIMKLSFGPCRSIWIHAEILSFLN